MNKVIIIEVTGGTIDLKVVDDNGQKIPIRDNSGVVTGFEDPTKVRVSRMDGDTVQWKCAHGAWKIDFNGNSPWDGDSVLKDSLAAPRCVQVQRYTNGTRPRDFPASSSTPTGQLKATSQPNDEFSYTITLKPNGPPPPPGQQCQPLGPITNAPRIRIIA